MDPKILKEGSYRKKIYLPWIAFSLLFTSILIFGELYYESFAKDWDSGITRRHPSIFELPGMQLNKCALLVYSLVAETNNHSIWEYPVRIILSAIILICSVNLGFVCALLLRVMKCKRLYKRR